MVDVSIWFLIVTFFVSFYLGISFRKDSFTDVIFKMFLYLIAGFCVYYLYTGKL